jgi:hypothetical protein
MFIQNGVLMRWVRECGMVPAGAQGTEQWSDPAVMGALTTALSIGRLAPTVRYVLKFAFAGSDAL